MLGVALLVLQTTLSFQTSLAIEVARSKTAGYVNFLETLRVPFMIMMMIIVTIIIMAIGHYSVLQGRLCSKADFAIGE